MLDKIQSTPAKVCLGLTAIVMFVYSLNFMFFADCYSIGGDSCFTLLNNKSEVGDVNRFQWNIDVWHLPFFNDYFS